MTRPRTPDPTPAALEVTTGRRLAGDPRVTPRQLRVIEALLDGLPLVEVAGAAGVAPRTVQSWRHDPGFAAALEAATDLVQRAFTVRLVGLRDAAADRVAALLPSMEAGPAIRLLVEAADRTGFPRTERVEAALPPVTVDPRLAAMSDEELRRLVGEDEP